MIVVTAPITFGHEKAHRVATVSGLTATLSLWHPQPEYRFFKVTDHSIGKAGLFIEEKAESFKEWSPNTQD